MYRYFTNSVKGFTLIELLVVIAIIGILSSIVLASLNTARLKSRDARRIADIKQIQLAMQLFYDANSSYVTTTLLASLVPTYIATIPKDPVGQDDYPFDKLGISTDGKTSTSYHIGTNLEDAANQALKSDIDSDTTTVKGVDDTKDCTGTVSGRYCYDVGP